MLDCGLTSQTVLNFLPLPLVQSSRFQSLPNWICPRDHDAQADGELKECCNRIFIDSPPEFNAPLDKIVDFSEIDIILISNYMNMLALPFITGKLHHRTLLRIVFSFLIVLFHRRNWLQWHRVRYRTDTSNWPFFLGRTRRIHRRCA